jgi:ABC-type bacteriocin/lantibiotic exporter with double-glycine peptidase domain
MAKAGFGGEWAARLKEIYRFVWRTSGRAQFYLAILAVAVFALEFVPLELQRRVVNDAVENGSLRTVLTLCGLYFLVVLLQGGLKLALNVYRGSVTESVCQRLRLEPALVAVARSGDDAREEGVAISVIASEVDSVGGFVGTAVSEPVLNGGILLSVFGYMLIIQPLLALIALALFIPQMLFIPLLQEAINRRTADRIQTVRKVAAEIVDSENGDGAAREEGYRARVARIYRLNMEIYRRKFGMNFLMNLLHHIGVIGILSVGGWFVMQGKTEVGTVVAFISGLARTNDPWNDLVDFFRNLTNAGVKYELIAQVVGRRQA